MPSDRGSGRVVDPDTSFVGRSKYRAEVLAHLVVEGPATPTAIAEAHEYRLSSVSQALGQLRQRDLVELRVPEETTKGHIYGATDDGRRALATLVRGPVAHGGVGVGVDDAPRPDDFPKADRRRVWAGQYADRDIDGDSLLADSEEVTGRVHEIERLLYEAEAAALTESAAANARRARALVVDVLVGDGVVGEGGAE